MQRTPATHPFAVDVIELSHCTRSGGTKRAYIGLQLFATMEQAQAYADDNETADDGASVQCIARKARSGDREFA
jgi:hypothetical protein